MYQIVNDYEITGGGITMSLESKVDALVSIGLTLKFIDSWKNHSRKIIFGKQWCVDRKISGLFNKIHVTIPESKPEKYKKKMNMLLSYIGGNGA